MFKQISSEDFAELADKLKMVYPNNRIYVDSNKKRINLKMDSRKIIQIEVKEKV